MSCRKGVQYTVDCQGIENIGTNSGSLSYLRSHLRRIYCIWEDEKCLLNREIVLWRVHWDKKWALKGGGYLSHLYTRSFYKLNILLKKKNILPKLNMSLTEADLSITMETFLTLASVITNIVDAFSITRAQRLSCLTFVDIFTEKSASLKTKMTKLLFYWINF